MQAEAPAAAWLRPGAGWPAGVAACMSTREGGVSAAPFDSLNLRPPALGGEGLDSADAVAENQRRFAAALGARPVWLNQVHGKAVVSLGPEWLQAPLRQTHFPTADGAVSRTPGVACAVLVADCLPVLLASRCGRVVGAAHAGWRGLAAGVIEATVQAMRSLAPEADEAVAWLGACIGAQAFEVGGEVVQALGVQPTAALRLAADGVAAQDLHQCFAHAPRADGSPRWRADLASLARLRLRAAGVSTVLGGGGCTHADAARFFSFRREPRTGRMAAAVAPHARPPGFTQARPARESS